MRKPRPTETNRRRSSGFSLDQMNTTAIRRDLEIPERRWYSSPLLIFLSATTVAFVVGAVAITFMYRQLDAQLTESVKLDAVNVVRYLQRRAGSLGVLLETRTFGSRFAGEVENLHADFGIWKIKLYARDGEVVFSTDADETGTVNDNPYFKARVARGEIIAERVTRLGTTLEHKQAPMDVLEVYVPIIEQKTFLGAVELYYDITTFKRGRDVLLAKVVGIALLAGVAVLAVLGLAAFKGKRLEEERVRAEDDLIESEKRFRTLIESSPVGLFIVQEKGIVYQNPQQVKLRDPFTEAFEIARFESVHADDRDKFRVFVEAVAAGGSELEEVTFRYYPDAAQRGPLDLRWASCHANPIEYQGSPAVLVNMIDLTRAKRLEQLIRTQDKMISLGRVSAGIAHEIRNPLSGINIYLDALRTSGGQASPEVLDQIQAASRKIEAVINRVMDFAKPGEPNFILDDINSAIEEALGLAAAVLRKAGVAVEVKLRRGIPKCRIDRHLIEQVMLNLISNAAEAMKHNTHPRMIEVESLAEGDRIRIRVADSGPGVPLELRDVVFEPFYTTKHAGTGIGLSFCHRIITDHGGTITVGTGRLGGAVFVIEIPVSTTAGAQ